MYEVLGTSNTLNCGIGGDRVQNVLWRDQNLPVISSLRNVVILCLFYYLFQDSPEDIADGIIEIVQTFQSSYNSINIAIGGILPPDTSWPVNGVLIKEVNKQSAPSHSVHTSVTIVVALLQIVRLTQTSSFQIMCT